MVSKAGSWLYSPTQAPSVLNSAVKLAGRWR